MENRKMESIKMESRASKAVECFSGVNRFNCAQAVFSTYCEDFGLDRELALKLSCGFGGGMGRLGNTCGAVSGAYMVIGLKHGKFLPEDEESRRKTYALVAEFEKKFVERNNTTVCREILGIDLRTCDEETRKKQTGKFCRKMIQDAAEILESMLGLA